MATGNQNYTSDVSRISKHLKSWYITTETAIPWHTCTPLGAGETWTGSDNGMAYAAILHIGNDYSRAWQIWAKRGDSQSLYWRHPNEDANAWQPVHTILDSHNYDTYAVKKSGDTMTGSLTLNDHLYLDTGKQIYMKYNSNWVILRNFSNGNIGLQAAGSGLYIGYSNTTESHFYYSSGDSRTEFFAINSNGAKAVTRFGVNGQNTSYTLYVNGSTLHNGYIYLANGTTYYINSSGTANLYGITVNSTLVAKDTVQINNAANSSGIWHLGNTNTKYMGWSGLIRNSPGSGDLYYDTRWRTYYYSYNSSTKARKDVYEQYDLPTVTADLTENKSYVIRTSKDDNYAVRGLFSGNPTDSTSNTADVRIKTAIQSYFSTNYASIQRGTGLGFYVSHGNASMALGYYVSGYNSTPYGGFFVATYSIPYYLGINNGTYTISQLWKKGDSVTGAVWNDYAEYRASHTTEPGYVVMEKGDDTLIKTEKRLSHFAGVTSDTWGFAQGETERAKTPLAVAGRVLVYTYQNRNNYKAGDCVCAAPNGTVDIMTREEVINYPDRVVGTVSCVPTYDEWGGGDGADRKPVKVNGRIWIKVK